MKSGFRLILSIIGIVCFILMITIKYDKDFIFTASLPLAYTVLIAFVCTNKMLSCGLGGTALVLFYCFRLCLLPVICAMGNFYMEPNKVDYIGYYNQGICLILIESLIVFVSLRHYTNKFSRLSVHRVSYLKRNNHQFINISVIVLTIMVIILQLGLGVDYYSFITSQADEFIREELSQPKQGPLWYITDILSTWWRPLVTFLLIFYFQKKIPKHSDSLIILIALVNILYMSDRRIYALLVGGFALYYAMVNTKSIITKRAIFILLGASGALTAFFGFYTSMTEDFSMVSRTFQHYFSGPTLNALSLRVFDNEGVRPLEFVKLLLNDFQIFTATIGRFDIPDYFMSLYGVSQGLWVPSVVGSVRYFGILFPLPTIFFVYYIKKCDYDSQREYYPLYKMIYSFIAVTVSCYMVMYTVELIFYFILSTAVLYRILIYFDKRLKFKI